MKSYNNKPAAVILAAGKGTRMKSEIPKVLHPLMGKPMVMHVVEACKAAGIDRIILVVGHGADAVKNTLGTHYEYVQQTEQLGTGHALMMAEELLKAFDKDLLVLAGDTPFLTGEILSDLIELHQKKNAAATLLTAILHPPPDYGCIIRDTKGHISKITEARDTSDAQLLTREVNTSHYCFDAQTLFSLLKNLKTDNDQKEYYLTDVIQMLVKDGAVVESLQSEDPDIALGIDNLIHLAEAFAIYREKIVRNLCMSGVTLLDPTSVYIEPHVKIAADTVIYPFTSITGKTEIGKNCHIGPHVRITDSQLGDNIKVEFTVIENRRLDSGQQLGPFACLTHID